MTDIPVDPRSWEEIERVAEGWRKVLDPEDLWAPDILALLKRAGLQFEATKGLEVIFLPNAQMGDDEARAEFDPPRIFVRQSLEAEARDNTSRLRSTLSHELGHIVLHPGAPKSRKAGGNTSLVNLSAFRSAEAQAWVFARAFLMPSWKAQQVRSAPELSLRCRVSPEIALIRYSQFQAKQGRAELPEVRRAIDDLKSLERPSFGDPKILAARQRTEAWERAPHIPGKDPSRFRRSADGNCGFTIERSEYENASSQHGWYVYNGKAFAYVGRAKSE